MPPRKRPRNNEACSALPTLPADLVLEIAARSDSTALIRCAAACRLLRGHILTQQQVFAGVVHRYVLASPHNRRPGSRKPAVSLVYPATPAASSLVHKRLAPFVSRRADLLHQYYHVTSCRGLVVLRLRRRERRHLNDRCTRSDSDLCVYDPMTDVRTFLPEPPDVSMGYGKATDSTFVLLTAADGIGCHSFLLLVANMSICNTESTLRVQTSALTDAGGISWGPVTMSVCHSGSFEVDNGLAVLPGGVIHWLTRDRKILRYDVQTGKSSTMKKPHMPGEHREHDLAILPDGKLRILAVQELMISVWEQLSAGDWSPGARIDIAEKLRSIHPKSIIYCPELRYSHDIRSNVLLLQINDRRTTVLIDLETKEMRTQQDWASACFFEVDLLHGYKL